MWNTSTDHVLLVAQTAIPIDQDKIVAIIESDRPDNTGPNTPADANSEAIAGHLIDFLSHEVKMGRLPENLLPLQSGIGNIANAVIGGLAKSPFKDVTVYVQHVLFTYYMDD